LPDNIQQQFATRLSTGPGLILSVILFVMLGGPASADTLSIGRAASAADIARWDIDVGPDGVGLPPGGATAAQGETVYNSQCAGCHGPQGRRGRDRLAAAPGDERRKTIGNYWPYATTIFDYVRRAMPPGAPGSLSDEQVYALTAYILYLNSIIPADQRIDAESLPGIEMPARKRFVPDNRRGGPEVR